MSSYRTRTSSIKNPEFLLLLLPQSEKPQYTKATNKLSNIFTSSLKIQNQNSTERDCHRSDGYLSGWPLKKCSYTLPKIRKFYTHKMKNLAWSTQILRKIYAKFTEITQNLRKFCKILETLPEVRKFYVKFTQNLRKFTQNIFAFAHQNFEWSTPRVITEILPN